MDWIALTVAEIRAETPLIRSLRLERPHGEPLPAWEPGAHVRIALPDGDDRPYSLVNLSAEPGATSRPDHYRLGVRLEEPGRGGSRYVHDLAVGQTVRVSLPSNDFVLEPSRAPVVLVAGGIGVTPITAMAARLVAAGDPFRLHYLVRSEEHAAFRDEIAALAGEHLALHRDDRDGVFDLAGLMRGLIADEPLYLCGPTPMIEAAIALAAELGWSPGRLHFEVFAAAAPKAGDAAFEVELRASGQTLTVPADRTILDAMIEAGLDPLYDCKRGDCGICQATVLEGVPDHRDFILSEAERDAGGLIQICVSRSKTPRLVLDL
jgi:ferredoxin-NADP reductase